MTTRKYRNWSVFSPNFNRLRRGTYIFVLRTTDERMIYIRGPFESLVVWRQCAAVMQREVVVAVT
jgi:hypothetical protein